MFFVHNVGTLKIIAIFAHTSFWKKSANLQLKRINTLYYNTMRVLQICCRLMVLWQVVADLV